MSTIPQLTSACMQCKHREVTRLLATGVNINGRDVKGTTPLYVAMCSMNTTIVRILLACDRTMLDATTSWGSTGLHAACCFNHVESVKLFLDHPRCTENIVTLRTSNGDTAAMLAESNSNQECVKLVRDYLSKPIKEPVHYRMGWNQRLLKHNEHRFVSNNEAAIADASAPSSFEVSSTFLASAASSPSVPSAASVLSLVPECPVCQILNRTSIVA